MREKLTILFSFTIFMLSVFACSNINNILQIDKRYGLLSNALSKLKEYLKFTNTASPKSGIDSVLNFIIKGKDLLISESHDDINDLSESINFLLSKSK